MEDTGKEQGVMQGWRVSRRLGWRILALGAAWAVSGLVLCAPVAWAVSSHVFDPSLSLRGDASDPGASHPLKSFENPCGVAVDPHGDIYVASAAIGNGSGKEGRIDVFNPKGEYLTEIADEHQPCSLAVDSEGSVYTVEFQGKSTVVFKADSYPPTTATKYGPRTVIRDEGSWAVAVDPSNDRVYVAWGYVAEYKSAAEGSALLQDDIGKGVVSKGLIGEESLRGVGVYGANHDVYASGVEVGSEHPGQPESARVFVLDGGDGHLKAEIDGSETPAGGFSFIFGKAGIAVDQINGDVYVDDTHENGVVDQFDASGSYIGQLPAPPSLVSPTPFAGLAVDDPIVKGEVAYGSPNEGRVFVGSGTKSSDSHLYAYAPRITGGPEVRDQAAREVTEAEAVLGAELNPHGLPTTYHFELTTEADFLSEEYAGAIRVPAPDAGSGEGGAFVPVSEPIVGLAPDTLYRFRLIAENDEGIVEGEAGEGARFSTYPAESGLPDGRAYELVTPPNTNGRAPSLAELGEGFFGGFETDPVASNGEGLLFGTVGGALPDMEAGGFNDTYEALRGLSSWESGFSGLSGTEAERVSFGGASPDHRFAFWEAKDCNGILTFCGPGISPHFGYLRRAGGAINAQCTPPTEPAGPFEFTGCGSLGVDRHAVGKWITAGATHVIFATGAGAVQLEPDAAPAGTASVYDRTPAGTRVVSLKPGGAPFGSGENASYVGVSEDGSAIAFEVKGTTYVRAGGETREVPGGEVAFGGLSQDGSRLFYLVPSGTEPEFEGTSIPQGDIFSLDTATGSVQAVGSGEESVLVNVSPDGSRVYFVSRQQLNGGAEGEEVGKDNLYVWDGVGVRLVAIVTAADVEGGEIQKGGDLAGGLGLWVTHALAPTPARTAGPAADPSRATADGSVFVFESHANLTEYDSGKHSEVYRYNATDESLTCVSCNPTGVAAESDAQLESNTGPPLLAGPPVNALTHIANVTSDGSRVFFQSADRLVPADNDGKVDVYEWVAQGTAGCGRASGCVSLISSGHSAGNDYLYAMTPDGDNVFFESGDLLVGADTDTTPSIYDARAGGGFAEATEEEPCQGDACRSGGAFVPSLPSGPSGPFAASPKTHPAAPPCPKGKRKVRSKGKSKCVSKHTPKRHSHGNGKRHPKSGKAAR